MKATDRTQDWSEVLKGATPEQVANVPLQPWKPPKFRSRLKVTGIRRGLYIYPNAERS